MANFLKKVLTVFAFTFIFFATANAAPLGVQQGGTGTTTLLGCLQGNGISAITGTGSNCGSGGGGLDSYNVSSTNSFITVSTTTTSASLTFSSSTLGLGTAAYLPSNNWLASTTSYLSNLLGGLNAILGNSTTTNATTTTFAITGITNSLLGTDANGNVIATTSTGGGTPAGFTGQLQFNNGGVFGATSSPVVGYITATSTTKASNFPLASTTAISESSLYDTGVLFAGTNGLISNSPLWTFDTGNQSMLLNTNSTAGSALNLSIGGHTDGMVGLNTVVISNLDVAHASENIGIKTQVYQTVPTTDIDLHGIKVLANVGPTMGSNDGVFIGNQGNVSSAIYNAALYIANQTSGALNWAIRSDGGKSSFSGNMGLGGQLNPAYPLDVSGSGHFTSFVDADHFVATSSTATSTFAGNVSINGVASSTSSQVNGNATTTGNVVIGGQITSYNGVSDLDVPIIVAKAHTSASTKTGTLLSYTAPSDGYYDIRIILNVSAISVDTIRTAIHFTDPDNITTWYYVCTALTSAPSSCTTNLPVAVKGGTTMTAGTELVVSGGSVTYSAASTIIKETSY